MIYRSKGGRVGSAGLPVIIPRLLSRGCWDEAGETRCVYGSTARRGGAQAADGGESKERFQQRCSTAGLSKTVGTGGQWPSQILTDHLNLILTIETDCAHYITTCPFPPRFSDPPMALYRWLAGIMHRQRLNHSSHLNCPLSL